MLFRSKRDLEIMIEAGVKNKIPVIVGTAGGSGGDIHLKWCEDIVLEIAKEKNLNFKLALIHSEFDKSEIKEALKAGKVEPLGPAPELTEEAVEATSRIVGQMGVEPFIRALDNEADVILAGRTYDPSVFAAPAIRAGYDEALRSKSVV